MTQENSGTYGKIHVNDRGETGVCGVTVGVCPYAGNGHYDTQEQADKFVKETYGNDTYKPLRKANKVITPKHNSTGHVKLMNTSGRALLEGSIGQSLDSYVSRAKERAAYVKEPRGRKAAMAKNVASYLKMADGVASRNTLAALESKSSPDFSRLESFAMPAKSADMTREALKARKPNTFSIPEGMEKYFNMEK